MSATPTRHASHAHATRAKPGQTACGDCCGVWLDEGRSVFAVADGLGHGPEAAEASEAAMRFLDLHRHQDIDTLFRGCDDALRNTRGTALAIAIVDHARQQLTLASVGNIRAVLLQHDRERRLGGCAGIVGAGFNRLAPDILPLETGDRLLMFSDGLPEDLHLRDILSGRPEPGTAVACLIEQHSSGRDDAAALAYFHSASAL